MQELTSTFRVAFPIPEDSADLDALQSSTLQGYMKGAKMELGHMIVSYLDRFGVCTVTQPQHTYTNSDSLSDHVISVTIAATGG